MPTKSWLYSKTIWTNIVGMVAFGLYFAGYNISPADQAQITGDVMAAIGIIVSAVSIIGRVVATHRITK